MIRPAAIEDLDAVLALAAARRSEYATSQPRFWRPAPDAAARHAPYLTGLITDPAVITLVAEAGTVLVGYAVGQVGPAPPVYDPGGPTCTVDDFAVADPELWATVGVDLLTAVTREATVRAPSRWSWSRPPTTTRNGLLSPAEVSRPHRSGGSPPPQLPSTTSAAATSVTVSG